MIAALKGKVVDSRPGTLNLENALGIVFGLQVPVYSFARLEPGMEVKLYTVFKIKDENPLLYGFLQMTEKILFEKLLTVAGVGGRTALALISAFSSSELKSAVDQGDVAGLSSVPGIGRKTAQRIVLELSGKLESASVTGVFDRLQEDVVSALVNLGYPLRQVREELNKCLGPGATESGFEPLFKEVLRRVSR